MHFLVSIGEWFVDTWDNVRLKWTEEAIVRLEKDLDRVEVKIEDLADIYSQIDGHNIARQKILDRIRARERRQRTAKQTWWA